MTSIGAQGQAAAAVEEALRQSASTFRSPRMFDRDGTDADDGIVRWKPAKSLWISFMTVAAVVGTPFTYQVLERTWMAQQIPWAIIFFAVGGIPWVTWGIAARVAASVTGHWLVGYFAHNRGPRTWHIEGAGVQGYNVPYCGLITMGEAWHNNHHAFPSSARLGLRGDEPDPGWWVLGALARAGLVWDIKTPDMLPNRPNLVLLGP